MFVDECLTGRNIGTHEQLGRLGSHSRIFDLNLLESSGFGIESGFPELVGIHLTETLVSLEGEGAFVRSPVLLKSFIIIGIFLFSLLRHSLVKRRHGNIDMALKYELGHESVEKSEQKRRYMSAVNVRIGHDYDLVITKLAYI